MKLIYWLLKIDTAFFLIAFSSPLSVPDSWVNLLVFEFLYPRRNLALISPCPHLNHNQRAQDHILLSLTSVPLIFIFHYCLAA